jgi:hypothetical protein
LGYNEKSIEKGGKKGSIGKEICLNFGQFKGLKIMNTRYCVVRELHTTSNQGNRLIICKFSWSGLSLSLNQIFSYPPRKNFIENL